MEAVAADQNVPVGIHLQEVPVLAVDHHTAEEREKRDKRSVHHWLKVRGGHPGLDPPCGEAGVVGVAQQLVRVPDGHQPVSDHLEAQALVFGGLVHCRRTQMWSDGIYRLRRTFGGSVRTRYGVVHVEAVAFDVFQSHASVHKHTEREEEL